MSSRGFKSVAVVRTCVAVFKNTVFEIQKGKIFDFFQLILKNQKIYITSISKNVIFCVVVLVFCVVFFF